MAAKRIVLNRKKYEQIRKMDHTQMSDWVVQVYKKGFFDGQSTMPSEEEMKAAIQSIKGIGPTKAEAICQTISDLIKGK